MKHSFFLLLFVGTSAYGSCIDISDDVVTKKVIKRQVIRTQVSGKLMERGIENIDENLASIDGQVIDGAPCEEPLASDSLKDDESLIKGDGQDQLGEELIVPLVLNYEFDKYRLTKSHILLLKDYINSSHFSHIIIDGHADTQGEETYNNNLSLRRAREVELFIKKLHGGEFDISVVGYGEDYPVCSTKQNKRDGCNRRVNVFLSTN